MMDLQSLQTEHASGRTKQSRRFTLIELLSVIVVIGILVAVLLPALMRAKYMAKLAADITNNKQIALSATLYASDNDLRYPTTKKVGWRQGAWNPIRYDGSEATVEYRADLIDYTNGGINEVWTCPMATHDWDGNGGFQKGGGEMGKSLDDMNLKGTRISYNMYFGRTGRGEYGDAWLTVGDGGWGKPYGSGIEFTPSKSMLKVGDAWEFGGGGYYTAGLYNGFKGVAGRGTWRVMSSDVYVRYHHGFWRFAHQGIEGNRLTNDKRFHHNSSYSDSYADTTLKIGTERTPGLARYDYTYSMDDGSAYVLRNLTAYDPRTAKVNEILVPYPEDDE